MLIVEGPDGAGKTTLIGKLKILTGLQTRARACTSEDGPVNELLEWVIQDLRSSNIHEGINDRYPLISELVYGPIIRSGGRLGRPDQLTSVYHRFVELNPFIVICLPPLENVRVNVIDTHTADTEHQRGVVKYVDTLWTAYSYMVSQLRAMGLTVFVWDYTRMDDSAIDTLVELIEYHRGA